MSSNDLSSDPIIIRVEEATKSYFADAHGNVNGVLTNDIFQLTTKIASIEMRQHGGKMYIASDKLIKAEVFTHTHTHTQGDGKGVCRITNLMHIESRIHA